MERSLVIIKPDAMERNLTGVIIDRLQKEGFKLVALKMVRVGRELAEKHYAAHRGKAFFEGLVNDIISMPVVVATFEGKNVVARIRKVVGATDPAKAELGTIRKEYGRDIQRNAVHASDTAENGEREVALYFAKEEIFSGA